MARGKRERQHLLAYELTDDHKAELVELIYLGHRHDDAARIIGSTGTQFRKHRRETSQYYDPDFAQQVADALGSEEHQRNFLERLRGLQDELVTDGNQRMIEKLSYQHDPQWEAAKHPNFINVGKVYLQQVAPGLSDDELDRVIEALEKAEGAKPDIDHAPLRALPTGE